MRYAWLLLPLLACTEAPAPATAEGDVITRVTAAARAIDADPSKADAILAEQGLDAATVEATMYEIAADPAKTDAWLDARKR